MFGTIKYYLPYRSIDVCSFCPKTFQKTFILYSHINFEHRNEIENTWMACDEVK
jgi:hypothetical protein